MNNLLPARFDDGEGEGTMAPDQHRRGVGSDGGVTTEMTRERGKVAARASVDKGGKGCYDGTAVK